MKRSIATIYLFLTCLGYLLAGSDNATTTEPKKGWNVGILPAVAFDSNLGFLYGGIVNLYDYGDGTGFPDFNQNLYLQLSAFTKGSMDAIVAFDSYTLVPDKHFTARISYNRNQAFSFYGFNGNQSLYHADYEDKNHTDYLTEVFYRYERKVIKADVVLQDRIGTGNIYWLGGIDLGYYDNRTVNIEKLNEGRDEDDLLPDVPTLYDRYLEWGLIGVDEADGGYDNSLKVGVVYDTRDRLTNPMKGIWTELIAKFAPGFLGNAHTNGRAALIHRQYFTLKKNRLSFAYRLWYEMAFGDVPYYAMTNLTASSYSEGFGGATTLRGILMNRVVGRQVGIGNLELRWKALHFRVMRQSFYLGMNAFLDGGRLFKAYDLNLSHVSADERSLYFNQSGKEWFSSAGAGLKVVMNENFVVSADYGVSMKDEYGNSGFYMSLGYLF